MAGHSAALVDRWMPWNPFHPSVLSLTPRPTAFHQAPPFAELRTVDRHVHKSDYCASPEFAVPEVLADANQFVTPLVARPSFDIDPCN